MKNSSKIHKRSIILAEIFVLSTIRNLFVQRREACQRYLIFFYFLDAIHATNTRQLSRSQSIHALIIAKVQVVTTDSRSLDRGEGRDRIRRRRNWDVERIERCLVMACSWIDAFVGLDARFRSARFDFVGWRCWWIPAMYKLIYVRLLLSVRKIYRREWISFRLSAAPGLRGSRWIDQFKDSLQRLPQWIVY